MTLMQLAFLCTLQQANLNYKDFESFYRDWEMLPVIVNGEKAGVILMNGPEVHPCILPKYFGYWFNKSIVSEVRKRISKYGKLTTQTLETCSVGIKFAKRIGFSKTGKTNGVIQWELLHL